MNEKSRNKAWELPGDFGDRLGVNQNNVAMVALAVLMDIRATLDEINGRQRGMDPKVGAEILKGQASLDPIATSPIQQKAAKGGRR